MNSTNHEEDMFKYVGDYTLYDIIGEYYPELSEDYSTENLLSNINPDINISTHDESYNVKKIYTGLIDRLLTLYIFFLHYKIHHIIHLLVYLLTLLNLL